MDLTPKFPRGENGGTKILDQQREFYKVRIDSIFVHAHSDHADDQLELSAMLPRSRIAGADGNYVKLFPEKAST
jgi:hypothetical protein